MPAQDHTMAGPTTCSVVILGLGMVGVSFIEKMLEYDTAKKYTFTAICEEPMGKETTIKQQEKALQNGSKD